jgi:hypothetical protein
MEAKEDKSSTGHVWAAAFQHVMAHSCLARFLKLINCLFLKFSNFFSGRGKLRITETVDTESMDTGAHLYNQLSHVSGY